jgi:hypothetical protein
MRALARFCFPLPYVNLPARFHVWATREPHVSNDDYNLAPESESAPAMPSQRARTATTTAAVRPAGQVPAAAGSGAFVRGNRIVARDGAVLPDRCVKCNAPAAGGRRTKRFPFNEDTSGPGAGRLIPVVGRILWVFWLIGQMNSRQRISVSYCVCKKHQSAQLIAIIAMAIGLIAGLALVGAAIANQNLALGIAGAAVFLIGAICGAGSKMLSVVNGLNNAAELTGAGKAFLDSLPRGGVPRILNKYGR